MEGTACWCLFVTDHFVVSLGEILSYAHENKLKILKRSNKGWQEVAINAVD